MFASTTHAGPARPFAPQVIEVYRSNRTRQRRRRIIAAGLFAVAVIAVIAAVGVMR